MRHSKRVRQHLLGEVEQEIEELRERLAELEAVRSFLLKELAGFEKVGRVKSQIDAIRELFEKEPNRHWTVAKIYDRLVKDGFEFGAQVPKASISVTLGNLVERGEIIAHATAKPKKYRAAKLAHKLLSQIERIEGKRKKPTGYKSEDLIK